MEIARDEVRVMTVHGAKGLEAPIVILADTMTPPAGPRHPRLLTLSAGAMVWAGRKADDVAAVSAARQNFLSEAEHEYRRLLYVAMTRAADLLIVCGAEGQRKRPAGCWYDLICEPLAPFLSEETTGTDKVLRYRSKTVSATASPTKSLSAMSKNLSSESCRPGCGSPCPLSRRTLHRYRHPPPLRTRSSAPPVPALPPSSGKRRLNAAGSCIG